MCRSVHWTQSQCIFAVPDPPMSSRLSPSPLHAKTELTAFSGVDAVFWHVDSDRDVHVLPTVLPSGSSSAVCGGSEAAARWDVLG